MRSLGRPNREQVVTTRPEELSTLQALDLSNGEILTEWLKTGAKNWRERKLDRQWSNEELIEQLFVEALSRRPTPDELQPLAASVDADSAEELAMIEDLLWLIVMLPEFQLIH